MTDFKLQFILEAQDRGVETVLDRLDNKTKKSVTATERASKAEERAAEKAIALSKKREAEERRAAEKASALAKKREAEERTASERRVRAAEAHAQRMGLIEERAHRDNAERDRAAHDRQMQAIQKRWSALESVGQKAAMAGGAITAASALAIRASMEQEKARASAMNAFSGVNGLDGHWEAINRQAVEYGNLYPGTTGDYLKLATALKETGMATEIIEKGAFRGAAALKVLFDLAPSEAGQQFGALMKAYGIEGKDAPAFADLLQRQKYATGMSLQEISVAAPYIGSKLAAYDIRGLDAAKQTAIVMGVLKQSNLEGSMIGTAFGSFLDKAATVDARARHLRGGVNVEAFGVLEKKGLHMDFFDEKGAFKGLPNAIVQLSRLKDLTQQERKLVMTSLFGQEGERMSLVNPEKWNQVAEALLAQEQIEDRLGRVTGTLAAKWEAVGGSASNAADRMVDKLKPILLPLLDKVNSLLDRIGKWADAHPRLAALIGTTTLALGGLLVVGGGLLWTTSKLWTGLKEGLILFRLMPEAVTATTTAMEANAVASKATEVGVMGVGRAVGMVAVKLGLLLAALKLFSEVSEGIEKTFKPRSEMDKDISGAAEKAKKIRPVLESFSPESRAAYFRHLDPRKDVDNRTIQQAMAYERAWKKTYADTNGDLTKADAAGESARWQKEYEQQKWADQDMKHPFRKWFGFGKEDPSKTPAAPGVVYSPSYQIHGTSIGPEELKKILREHGDSFGQFLTQWQASQGRAVFGGAE